MKFMTLNNLQKILTHFDLKAEKILASQKGYRNQVLPIIIKGKKTPSACLVIYKNEANIVNKIKRANFVSDYLQKHNFPTKKTLKNKNKQTIFKLHNNSQFRYACLYSYLPGETICWEDYSQKHLKLLGKSLSLMHQNLTEIDSQKLNNWPLAVNILQKLNAEMQIYFAKAGVKKAINKKLGLKIPSKKLFIQFEKILEKANQLGQNQILHLDFVRSNLLFANQTTSNSLNFDTLSITGILDFEKTALGNPILDITRTLAFLLVDCKYKIPTKIKKYFLWSGYVKHGGGQLNAQQLALVNPLIKFFLFYDFYKFLLHNPYESLEKNEHFIRTKKILQNANSPSKKTPK